ncbi:DUF3179 domain-containing protein [candidate division WOR-3 bacterium]|uniref:DUF3179 domain-containing protein n=1 Tax=candidate division WOR-3 bacterium TaxID=2052148 RepID=A0A9D5QD95_UNCW3|nr:DUF3179 domain-containing protein [candidate division WOR-3 bacterium]MBD3365384.1 DUF3179 domain-containing protein [candidate division WOR-3 bacterium]
MVESQHKWHTIFIAETVSSCNKKRICDLTSLVCYWHEGDSQYNCMMSLNEKDKASDLNINFDEWKTDFNKYVVDLREVRSSVMWPKDMHPAVHNPEFSSVTEASKWLSAREPLISFTYKGKARGYPLGILLYHEIANDEVLDMPIAVTYCPLCNTAVVYNRRVGNRLFSFGVAGVLRRSNLVMYDRTTESWWQQITGQALVGEMAGEMLDRLPSQLISFSQFSSVYPKGRILTPYFWGTNRYYQGYDDTSPDSRPRYCPEGVDGRFHPAQRLITLDIDGKYMAYPYSATSKLHVINDEFAGRQIVVFHSGGALSPVDDYEIAKSREVGSTGVFNRNADDETLSFSYRDGMFADDQTSSLWDITGRCIEGKLEGRRLEQVVHGNDFWFVWITFHPDSEIFQS